MHSTDAFRNARDLLIECRQDHERAYREFRWPVLDHFNWALDWFDVIARNNQNLALKVFDGSRLTGKRTYQELFDHSNRIASALSSLGVRRGDSLLLMLGNSVCLWESMLAAMKLGAVVIPAAAQLSGADLQDRLSRGNVRHVIAESTSAGKFPSGDFTQISVGETVPGWTPFDALYEGSPTPRFEGETRASDPLLLYFTSGTTAKPKLVLHTHQSYPVGHLSTMFWIGLQPGDIHFNISSPGWAKHAWSSFFAPWNAEATVIAYDYKHFECRRAFSLLREEGVHSICAPPTVWRLFLLEELGERPASLREAVSAGEPLNPEVIEKVQASWGITVRDGYGQTESTAQIGNPPGTIPKTGSMGKPLPGYRVTLLTSEGEQTNEGEIALHLNPAPLGLMQGYLNDPARMSEVMKDGFYRTGDEARIDADGYFFYVARGDDVFKSADYRISPFELESALMEHPAVAEAAVVAAPDELRLNVPKAFIVLKEAFPPTAETAHDLFAFIRRRLAPFQRIRIIEFGPLPKTISGKIRRVELRARTPGEEFRSGYG